MQCFQVFLCVFCLEKVWNNICCRVGIKSASVLCNYLVNCGNQSMKAVWNIWSNQYKTINIEKALIFFMFFHVLKLLDGIWWQILWHFCGSTDREWIDSNPDPVVQSAFKGNLSSNLTINQLFCFLFYKFYFCRYILGKKKKYTGFYLWIINGPQYALLYNFIWQK